MNTKIKNTGMMISGDIKIVPINDAAASANFLLALPLKITGNNIMEIIIKTTTGELNK